MCFIVEYHGFLGNVDLDAVEKYKEVKEKYDTMSEQINDLEKSRKELLDIISTLEKDMKTSFVECFNQINENFGRVFSELFGGGSAELSLTDPDNILESGIEIKAAPPGKIIKNLMQLSGTAFGYSWERGGWRFLRAGKA